jgi:hypothetical protein
MLEKTSKIEFVRVGLLRYPDARETVDYFQTSVTEAIFAAFEAKTNWKYFQPFRDPGGSLEAGKATGSVDRYIHAFIAGTLPNRNGGKEKVWIYLGLYWKPPRRPHAPVVAACSCSVDKGGAVPLLDLPGRDPQVELGALYKRGERRLLLAAREEDFDLDQAFSLLLDCIDEAMAVVESVNVTSVGPQL